MIFFLIWFWLVSVAFFTGFFSKLDIIFLSFYVIITIVVISYFFIFLQFSIADLCMLSDSCMAIQIVTVARK